MDRPAGAHVEAAGGRVGDEHAGLPPELAREQEFLGVAAGEQPGRRRRRCAVDAVGVDRLRRRRFHDSAAHKRRAAVLACRHAGHAVVLVDRELGQQAVAETVGRDGAQPPAAKGGHVPAREIGAVDGDPAAGGRPQPGQRVGELLLPVAAVASHPKARYPTRHATASASQTKRR